MFPKSIFAKHQLEHIYDRKNQAVLSVKTAAKRRRRGIAAVAREGGQRAVESTGIQPRDPREASHAVGAFGTGGETLKKSLEISGCIQGLRLLPAGANPRLTPDTTGTG